MSLDLRRRRDLGRILDDAFAVYRGHWRTLLAVAAAVVVPVHLLVLGVGLGWLWSGYPAGGDAVGLTGVGDSIVALAAQLLVVTPLVTAMAVHVVRRAAAGERPAAGETLAAGLEVFAALFGAVVLVALAVALGFLALIVPGVILAVRLVVVPQAVVIEGARGGDALRRSLALTAGRFWFVFLVVFVANLLVGVLSAVLLVPLELAAEAADAQALSLLGEALGAILTLPLIAVAYTLLYFALLAERGEAPGPGADAPSGGERASAPGGPGGDGRARTIPGVPGTFGDGFAPPTAPRRGPSPPS